MNTFGIRMFLTIEIITNYLQCHKYRIVDL